MIRRNACADVGRCIVALAVAAAVVFASCGQSRDTAQDRREIRGSLASLHKSIERQDAAEVCRLLTRLAREQVGRIGHSLPKECLKDVRRFMLSVEGDPTARPVDPRIATIYLDGDRATVVVAYDARAAGAFAMAKEDGVWKLASVFSATRTTTKSNGTPIPRLQTVSVAAVAGAASRGRPVRVTDEDMSPCPAIVVGQLTAHGGCVVRGRGEVEFRLKTLFGDTHFATCDMDFEMNVDGVGRLSVDEVDNDRRPQDEHSACNDIEQCQRPEDDDLTIPWRGRLLEADGRLVADLAACFDTCAGRLQGTTRLRVTRTADGYRVRSARSVVGRSGLSIGGSVTLTPDALRVHADSRSG